MINFHTVSACGFSVIEQECIGLKTSFLLAVKLDCSSLLTWAMTVQNSMHLVVVVCTYRNYILLAISRRNSCVKVNSPDVANLMYACV